MGGPWAKVVNQSESEGLSDEFAEIMMGATDSSQSTGQSGSVNGVGLPSETAKRMSR